MTSKVTKLIDNSREIDSLIEQLGEKFALRIEYARDLQETVQPALFRRFFQRGPVDIAMTPVGRWCSAGGLSTRNFRKLADHDSIIVGGGE